MKQAQNIITKQVDMAVRNVVYSNLPRDTKLLQLRNVAMGLIRESGLSEEASERLLDTLLAHTKDSKEE